VVVAQLQLHIDSASDTFARNTSKYPLTGFPGPNHTLQSSPQTYIYALRTGQTGVAYNFTDSQRCRNRF